jgi:hypothetical protein
VSFEHSVHQHPLGASTCFTWHITCTQQTEENSRCYSRSSRNAGNTIAAISLQNLMQYYVIPLVLVEVTCLHMRLEWFMIASCRAAAAAVVGRQISIRVLHLLSAFLICLLFPDILFDQITWMIVLPFLFHSYHIILRLQAAVPLS